MWSKQPFYCKLKPEWVMRGWDDLPHALVNTRSGQLIAFDSTAFLAVSASDGKTDFNLPIFLDIHRKVRDGLLAEGVVERTEAPSPLDMSQGYRKAPNPYHKTLHWSVTGACNLKCRHCFLCAPDRKYEDLGFPEIRRLVGEMAEAGIMEVSITGGEPFVRKDIWDILSLLVDSGIRISQIYTNGVLVSDQVLERLDGVLGPAGGVRRTEFSLSFDGVGTHDDIRGIEGTEEKTVRAIERIRAHGFPVGIETVLYRKNVGRMAETLRLLSEKGVESWKISGVGDAGKWLETGGAETLTTRETFDCYLDLLGSFLSAGKPLGIQIGGFYAYSKASGLGAPIYGERGKRPDEGFLKRYSCNCSRYVRYLLSDGTLLPCMPMTGTAVHEKMPNVREMSLSQALKHPSLWEIASIRVGDLVERNRECAECEHLGGCGLGCRSCALIYGEGVFSKDPFVCCYWKEGWPDKIMECVGTHQSV